MSKFIIHFQNVSTGFFNYVLFARADEDVFVSQSIFLVNKNLKMMLKDNVFTLIKLNCVVSPLLFRYEFIKKSNYSHYDACLLVRCIPAIKMIKMHL